MRFLLIALILTTCVVEAAPRKPQTFTLTASDLKRGGTFNHDTDPNSNFFEVKLQGGQLIDSRSFFLILESENPDFVLTILDDSKGGKLAPLMDLTSFSGNLMMAMSDTFFNKNLDSFRKTGSLRFVVSNKSKLGSKDYRLRAEIGDSVALDMGRTYTTRVDFMLKKLVTDLHYNGEAQPDLHKLRFQVTSVRQHKDYSLSASLEHVGNFFQLNTIFQKTVGGILTLPDLPVCTSSNCVYRLTINLAKVKVINIESFMVSGTEILSIHHFEEYYDRVYKNDVVTYYELPYENSMEEMDITISLIPVTGTTGLYVNAKTLPLELDNFDWKEKGPLAKRITIRWDELVQMKAEKSNLFIAVYTTKPGEYLIKLDAHDPGYKGRLNSGIIEAGFVQYNEINNYLYFFEVYENQQITFDLRLNIISGDADLYLKQCNSYANCKIDEDEMAGPDLLRVENSQNSKSITHTFTCEHKPMTTTTVCEFVIGLKGKENHGTHFEISLQEANFHRLMIPGHSVPLNLSTAQSVLLKFSNPSKNKNSKLFLSVEALWGSFDVIVSKQDAIPSESPKNSKEHFVSTKLGLYNSLKTISMDPAKFGDTTLQGVYYVLVQAETSCALNIKFYEKNSDEITIHTLIAGSPTRGEITRKGEIVYYTIKVSLNSEQASTVSISLTPLKGQYTLFASRNGKLPTSNSKDLYTTNNHLELIYQSYDNKQDEYIIGVQLSNDDDIEDSSYQFTISFVYSNKPLKLNPGIIVQHVVTEANNFLIEVSTEMKSLLILKSIIDGYNLQMCAKFTISDIAVANKNCDYTADDKHVSVYIDEQNLKDKCAATMKENAGSRCFIQVLIEGNKNQRFSIGFTYNDHPFQLIKGLVVTGPTPTSSDAQINFIYHAEPNKPVALYFNSKGRKIGFFTKLIRGDHFDQQSVLDFPNLASSDQKNQNSRGFVSNVMYDQKTVGEFGASPEVLISLRSMENGDGAFDSFHSFILQTTMDSQEILRTQTFNTHIEEDAWNYFTFYNNGNSDTLRVYVAATVATRIEVLLSKGLQSRPPLTNRPIASKVGIGSAEIKLRPKDLKIDQHSDSNQLKGHYTLAVKSSTNCNINVFWNNKEDLNYLELTPNEPSTMSLNTKKKFYFSFFAKDVDQKNVNDRGIISVYLKSNIKASVYMLKSGGELSAPSSSFHTWKGSLGQMGGVTIIQIKPDDPEYCVDCLYIGYVENESNGQISILANVRHDNIPILLTPGFTFPELLANNERVIYRVYNDDANLFHISLSMFSGFVTVYISGDSDISETKHQEKHVLENTLDIHKFIVVSPSKYKISSAHDYYILITNTKPDSAGFTITADKNSIKSPIEPGITKFIHLAPGESTDFVYTPQQAENLFEVRAEIRQITEEKFVVDVLENLKSFVTVYHINENNERYILKYKNKSASYNKMYINFDITENAKGMFAIHLFNPTGTGVSMSLDLLNGGYKLVNLNEFTVDMVKKDDPIIYEGYGQKSKYLFVDLKICSGDVAVEFFQGDYDNIAKKNNTEFKQIKDSNSMIHYIKLDHSRVFLRVTNKKEERSVYEISVFNERDLDNNPYSEIAQGNGGKVEIETDNNVIRFHPIKIKSTYSRDFIHKVTYSAYLTDNFKVMRYTKNCGHYMLNHVFDNPHVLSFTKTVIFENLDEVDKLKDKVQIEIGDLKANTKYYGVLVAKIELFPSEYGYISPVRSGKTYYDEFIFITPKYTIPFNLIISILICLGLLFVLSCVIKAVVFGRINQMKMFERLNDLSRYDEGLFGMNIIGILEKEYYGEEAEVATQPSDAEIVADESSGSDLETGANNEIELCDQNDTTKPLDA